MPRIPAAKKARQENMLKNRIPYQKPKTLDSVPETVDSDSSNLLLQPSTSTIQNDSSSSFLPEQKGTTLSESKLNHLKKLHASNKIKRDLAKDNKKALSDQNKAARQKRNNKLQYSSESADPFDFENDDFHSADTDADRENMNPRESKNQKFRDFPSPAKTPENQKISIEDLGFQHQKSDSQPGQISIAAALKDEKPEQNL